MNRAVRPGRIGLAALAVTFAIVAAACGSSDSGEPLDAAQASKQLDELADDIDWVDTPVTRSASIPPPTGANLADTLPPLDEFPITAAAPASADEVIEVWSSTEKSGEDTDGWYPRGGRRLQQRGHHAQRRLGRRSRPALDRVGHGVPVPRPRRRSPAGVHTVERAVGADGQRVPAHDRGAAEHRVERRGHRDEGRDRRRVARQVRRADTGDPRRCRDRRRPRDGLHRSVRLEYRAELPAHRARRHRRGRSRPAHVSRRRQCVRTVPAAGAVRGAHDAADA